MKVGIIGPDKMTRTWEQHLRVVSDVHEVIIARSISAFRDIDACLILNDSPSPKQRWTPLLEALKQGFHVLWVAPLPTDPDEINNWYDAAEESGVIVMFSMWSHYSPATQWLFNQISPPRKIHIHREWPGPQHTPDSNTRYRIILEEISLCLEWTKSRPVRIEGDFNISLVRGNKVPTIQQMHIEFSNQTTASIILSPFGLESRHSRFVSSDKIAAVCQINDHIIKKWLLHSKTSQTPEIMRFDYREPAQHLLAHFFRSVRSGAPPLFGISELNRLAYLMKPFPPG